MITPKMICVVDAPLLLRLELASRTMPPKPSSRPITCLSRIVSPPGISASTPIIQNGITDTMTAATPLGTNC